ncbi:hypothetical protein J4425_00365 [Candidatus Woesearchaeota archaeon]|nr:hypothetical protein [Candidatus Woesearchaeota archaeon]
MKKLISLFFIASLAFSRYADAHCPLCTVTAGVAAAGGVYLGVSRIVIGLLIGAFAMSMGMWFAKIVKKRYIPFQKTLIITIVFLATIIPLLPIFSSVAGFGVNLTGGYGTLLNKTYVIDLSLLSSFLGGLIVFIPPLLNRKIKEKTTIRIPFQGIILTFLILIAASLIIQFI